MYSHALVRGRPVALARIVSDQTPASATHAGADGGLHRADARFGQCHGLTQPRHLARCLDRTEPLNDSGRINQRHIRKGVLQERQILGRYC